VFEKKMMCRASPFFVFEVEDGNGGFQKIHVTRSKKKDGGHSPAYGRKKLKLKIENLKFKMGRKKRRQRPAYV
jgi:hypothetical protein